MLIAKNIIKRYASLQVLKGIDLNINKGEIVSIVGASGQEKYLIAYLGYIRPARRRKFNH
jgi:lipoprotein-releasing system ATP-binding protein